jgi:hypothetical protein
MQSVRTGPRGCPAHRDSAIARHSGGYRDAVDLPELLVAGAAEWRTWLSSNHSKSQGVWLVLAKKCTTHRTTLSYDDALDEAICFGWIDGQLGRRDSATFRRRFTPRSARSPWSQRNVTIAERLSISGRMHRSGEERRFARQRPMVDGIPPTPDKPAWQFQRTWRTP